MRIGALRSLMAWGALSRRSVARLHRSSSPSAHSRPLEVICMSTFEVSMHSSPGSSIWGRLALVAYGLVLVSVNALQLTLIIVTPAGRKTN